jgi:diacylglycerol kinase family enzyme
VPWADRLNFEAVRTHDFLVVNPRSGRGGPSPDELAAEAGRLGVETHVLAPGEDPAEVARAAEAERLGIAGGDGSLGAVAAVALETGAAFVCVPFGTKNHFARDVGLDRDDPIAALAAFSDGVERRIDVGRVGGRVFLNNVSLGAYAALVHRRESHRRRREALARVRALLVFARHRARLHARVDGEPVSARVLVVGNNRYELSLFTLGERERLDEGVLDLRVAAGVLPTAWDEETAPRFRIELPHERVRAAIDGEPAELETPLELESLPGALRVLLPRAQAEFRDDTEATMHDNPRATEDEQEEALEGRQQEEESMRYPEHHDPDEQQERARREGDE